MAAVHGRVSDIWRGYFAERIFHDLELKTVFTAPRVDQFRNPHNCEPRSCSVCSGVALSVSAAVRMGCVCTAYTVVGRSR